MNRKASGGHGLAIALGIVLIIVIAGVAVAYEGGYLTKTVTKDVGCQSNCGTQTNTTTYTNACWTASGSSLTGAGSTFVAPLMDQWTESSYTQNTITYDSVGSGAGISDLQGATVNYGASDAPMTYTQVAGFDGKSVLTMPEAAGAVAVIFNLPGVTTLDVNGAFLTELYSGVFHNWNNTMLQSLNPHDVLPNATIILAHRSDGSGTSFVFQEWLSDESSAWSSSYGWSTNWQGPTTYPDNANVTAVGEKGSSGIAGYVATTADSMGYVDLTYALNNHITYASVENPSGDYVSPTIADTQSAIADTLAKPGFSFPAGNGNWSGVSMLNAPGATDYPLATFTYLMFYEDAGTVSFSTAMTESMDQGLWNFLNWTISTSTVTHANAGQYYSPLLYFVPLPASVVASDQTTLNMMEWNGAPLCKTVASS